MKRNLLPIFRRRVIRDDRQNPLIHFQFKHPETKVPTVLTAYTVEGKAGLKGGAPLVDISFDNDLDNGIIQGFLNEADSKTLVAAALAAGTTEIEWDVKGTPAGGEDRQWFEGSGQAKGVMTP